MATKREDGIVPAAPAQPPRVNPPPPASPPSPPPASCKPDQDNSTDKEWFDLMIVGHTGLGKSTTADKIILAFYDYKPQSRSSSMRSEGRLGTLEDGVQQQLLEEDYCITSPDEGDSQDYKVRSKKKRFFFGGADSSPVVHRGGVTYRDLTVWTVDTDTELDEVPIVDYVKQLEVSGSVTASHMEVNNYRRGPTRRSPLTSTCQLISNDATRMRVLDVPGFFTLHSSDSPAQTSLENESESCTRSHIDVMREIIRIQHAMNIKFHRLLYFLPLRGPLDRPTKVLQHELLILARYFGKSIFEIMIIVATAQSRFSEMPEMQSRLFIEEEEEKTREQFQLALKEVLPDCSREELPDPPVVFISLLDECEEIVSKVKSANVAGAPLELSFDPSICIKCSSSVKEIERERILCIPKSRKKANHENISYIRYKESRCHPLFIPEHSQLEDVEVVEGDIQCVVLKRDLTVQRTMKEVCHKCGESPGQDGCMAVGSMYKITVKGKQLSILVDHTNRIEKHRRLSQNLEEDAVPSDEENRPLDNNQ